MPRVKREGKADLAASMPPKGKMKITNRKQAKEIERSKISRKEANQVEKSKRSKDGKKQTKMTKIKKNRFFLHIICICQKNVVLLQRD